MRRFVGGALGLAVMVAVVLSAVAVYRQYPLRARTPSPYNWSGEATIDPLGHQPLLEGDWETLLAGSDGRRTRLTIDRHTVTFRTPIQGRPDAVNVYPYCINSATTPPS